MFPIIKRIWVFIQWNDPAEDKITKEIIKCKVSGDNTDDTLSASTQLPQTAFHSTIAHSDIAERLQKQNQEVCVFTKISGIIF